MSVHDTCLYPQLITEFWLHLTNNGRRILLILRVGIPLEYFLCTDYLPYAPIGKYQVTWQGGGSCVWCTRPAESAEDLRVWEGHGQPTKCSRAGASAVLFHPYVSKIWNNPTGTVRSRLCFPLSLMSASWGFLHQKKVSDLFYQASELILTEITNLESYYHFIII